MSRHWTEPIIYSIHLFVLIALLTDDTRSTKNNQRDFYLVDKKYCRGSPSLRNSLCNNDNMCILTSQIYGTDLQFRPQFWFERSLDFDMILHSYVRTKSWGFSKVVPTLNIDFVGTPKTCLITVLFCWKFYSSHFIKSHLFSTFSVHTSLF